MIIHSDPIVCKDKLEKDLLEIYDQFFERMNIDEKTGLIKDLINEKKDWIDPKTKKQKRFSAYAYIGSKYGQKTKILFVGLDIGSDELSEEGREGTYLDFKKRREQVEEHELKNAHMLGTCICSIYFLKSEPELNKSDWETHPDKTYKETIKELKLLLNTENPLSYVALTNFHKFVTVGRGMQGKGEMMGSKDRHFINNNGTKTREIEEGVLVNEINTLKPKIIIFQSADFKKNTRLISKIKDILRDTKIYAGYHPSYRNLKRNSRKLITSLKEQ